MDFLQINADTSRQSPLGRERPYKWHNLQKTQLHARLALDPNTRRDAFALRYKSYLADGYIDPNPTSLFSDNYDQDPSSRTIVVYSGNEAVGSARISIMDVLDGSCNASSIPGHLVFPDEITEIIERVPELGRAKRAVEITRLVRHPNLAGDYGLIFLLLRLIGHLVTELDADVVLSCIRRNHIPFYSRLRFKVIAGPRSYPNLKFVTYLMICSRSDYDDVRRIAPVLDVHVEMKSTYSGLLRGNSVPVSRDIAV